MTAPLYSHPDGPSIRHDPAAQILIASDGETSTAVPIGPAGLIRFGLELIELGLDLSENRLGVSP